MRLHEPLDLLARKVLEDEKTFGMSFPYVTNPDGAWLTMPASTLAGYRGDGWDHGNWFCGFWVGLLLAAHLHTGDDAYLELADERMHLVAQRANDPNTHDIGFIFLSSAIHGAYITGQQWYADLGLRAAERLRARVVPTRAGAYISAWGPLSDPRGRSSSAIDTMANIPLLYWAARHSGDDSYRLVAEAHAQMTEWAFVRPDLSTFHAVDYDVVTGDPLRRYTFQGHADGSAWSRGQGWAIHGYAATAAATGDKRYLDLAERLADYYFARAGNDSAPFWDFDDPAIPNAPRDTATAAIVATALIDIGELHPDRAAGAVRKAQGVALLEGLCRDHLARDPSHRGLLMHGCYSKPHNKGPDAATLFGDYYFVTALAKVVMPGRFSPVLSPLA